MCSYIYEYQKNEENGSPEGDQYDAAVARLV
jgi:hypothetical protein